MKKKILSGILAVTCLLAGVHVFAAGTSGESLISLSYLNDVFYPALVSAIQTRAEADTESVYDAAQARLDEVGNRYLTGLSEAEAGDGWTYSDTVQVRQVKRNDVITAATGSTLLWIVGTATAEAGLVDVTVGRELPAGESLVAGHRYLSAEESGPVKVTVLSDAAQAALEGLWTVSSADEEDVTGFVDLVKSWQWFYDAMRYAVAQGMLTGISPTEMAPYESMNRAMLITVLYRMDGSPQVSFSGMFPDVPAGEWYANGVEWAVRADVADGMENGTFVPFELVSREQLAVMIYRYAGNYLHMDVSREADLSVFPDAGSVSDGARSAMAWAVGAGIITGADGNLVPHGNVNRAEVTTMLYRFQIWAGRV